jgi:hypothetical protein
LFLPRRRINTTAITVIHKTTTPPTTLPAIIEALLLFTGTGVTDGVEIEIDVGMEEVVGVMVDSNVGTVR